MELITDKSNDILIDYGQYLDSAGVAYETSNLYYHIGSSIRDYGWILHISVIVRQMTDLLKDILPAISNSGLAYKIIRDNKRHALLNDGSYSLFKSGKVITIYLENLERGMQLMEELMQKTVSFVGPRVLSDFYIGNILYTRFGSYRSKIVEDPFGSMDRILTDQAGKSIRDIYRIQVAEKPESDNPFYQWIVKNQREDSIGLIGGRFKPLNYMKTDFKGDVRRGFYFNRFGILRLCVIKEGRSFIFLNEQGRDMREFIRWQYEIFKEVLPFLAVPKMLQLVTENGSVYVVMEYLRGAKDFFKRVIAISSGRTWFDIPARDQDYILLLLEQILQSIQVLHEKGLVHRDVTGTNFMVDKKGKVYLVDLEMIYSLERNYPNPPSDLGTFGYTPPDRDEKHYPDPSYDIYGFGALLTATLNGAIDPGRFIDPTSPEATKKKLFFLWRNGAIVDLAMSCLRLEKEKRPSAVDLLPGLQALRRMRKETSWNIDFHFGQSTLVSTLEGGLKVLCSEKMSINGLWFSHVDNYYDHEVYPMGDKHFYWNFYQGTAGILYMLAKAVQCDIDMPDFSEYLGRGIQFINDRVVQRLGRVGPGLYFGSSGVSLCHFELIKAGLLPGSPADTRIITDCLIRENPFRDIQFGIAGDGLAAIQCREKFDGAILNDYLEKIVARLCREQYEDGSWKSRLEDDKEGTQLSFGDGVAGIVYFLLSYIQEFGKIEYVPVVEKALTYLQKKAIFKNGYTQWPINDRTKKSGYWWTNGGPGVALTFLKAYEVTRSKKYMNIAERALWRHPARVLGYNLSQSQGVAGLGEIYLEAFRVTGDNQWMQRASWIAESLCALKFGNDQEGYFWITEKHNFPTPELMMGNAGVLHFLLHFLYPGRLGFPGLPFQNR